MGIRLTKVRSCLIGGALMAGSLAGPLAPQPALAQYGGYNGDGNGYINEQPSYQPHYYGNNYQQHCYYTYVRVYDEYTGHYVTRRKRICD
jgi:hypothetical protein